jgi:hypothetical protein
VSVATARSGLLEEAEEQGIPLARAAHIQKIAHFHGRRFGSELSELGVGNALQHRVWVNKGGQPVEPIRPLSDRLRACRSRCLFEAIEARGHSAGLDDQQSIQGCHVVRRQSGSDVFVDLCMDLGTQMVCQPVQRAEGWQVNGGFAQRLDCPVDQVRRVAHRRRRLNHGRCHQLLACLSIDRSIEIGAYRRTVMMERRLSAGFIENLRYGSQRELRRQMRNGIAMNFKRSRKETKVLARFQQRCQRQAAGVAAGSCTYEGVVGFAHAVSVIQFLPRQFLTGARVGGAVNGCHKLSRKGSAVAVQRSVCFEGDRR